MMIGLVMNVDSFWSVVEVSGNTDVSTSFSSIDDNVSPNTSLVVTMLLISLIDVDVTVRIFDTSSVDISNEDFISVIEEDGIDVIIKSIFSAVLINTLFVCGVVGLLLVCVPSPVIGILSVVASSVFNAIDVNVRRLFELSVVVSVSSNVVSKEGIIKFVV